MATLSIGMDASKSNETQDLESLRRLVALADFLEMPDASPVTSNVQSVWIACSESEVKWDAIHYLSQ